jgi:hypothetical protein
VREIAECAAEIKACSLDELSEATCRAAHEFFHKLQPAGSPKGRNAER